MRAPLYLFLILVIAVTGGISWLKLRGPSALPPPHDNPAVERSLPALVGGRRIQHVTLSGGALGDIGFTVNLPDPLPQKKIPVVIVLGGLGSGRNNIEHVTQPGPNALVGLDWPIPVAFPQGLDFVRQIPELYRRVMAIPAQGAMMIGWAAGQPWADGKRISILGFSLGALAAPAIANLAARAGHPAGWTVIAYGGAPLGDLLAANPHMKPAWLRELLGPATDLLLRPVQPHVNLPELSGRFLVLEGREDALVPPHARDILRNAVPEPKDVIAFAGGHMGADAGQRQLLARIVAESRAWLLRNDAIDP